MRTSTLLVTAASLALSLVAAPDRATADDPALGATTYYTYESWFSPAQEPGEESEIPPPLVKSLGNTKPSTVRAARTSRGWGRIRFQKDLTRALVDVEIKGVAAEDIIMFHIHCGPPGGLGPVVVDLGKGKDLSKTLGTGKLSVEVTNADINFVSMLPKGFKPKLPESCPAEPGFPIQTKTVAGLEYLARKGVLYFNLHTRQHTYYGEMRGQVYPATK